MLICEYQFQSYGYGHGKFWQLLIEFLGIGSTTQHYCLTSVFCIWQKIGMALMRT